jgi:hypothetical protein
MARVLAEAQPVDKLGDLDLSERSHLELCAVHRGGVEVARSLDEVCQTSTHGG